MSDTTSSRPAAPSPATPPHPRSSSRDAVWPVVPDALRQAGEQAGRNAADWWAQDTVGGRAGGATAATAGTVLTGIDHGDPAVLDALPTFDLTGLSTDSTTEAGVYTDTAPPGAWDMDTHRRAEALETYRDGFDTAARDRVADHCRNALPGQQTDPGQPIDPVP